MYVEIQTKKLAQTAFLFSAASLCAILLCMAAIARHNVLVPQSVNFPVYSYQNPFHLTGTASSTAISGTKAGEGLAKLVSVNGILGLSGLAALWLASTWCLQGGWGKIKRIRRKVVYACANPPARMNPLAVLPAPVNRVIKQDAFSSHISSTVACQTTTRCLLAHRKTTAPCQSRFRPITLVSSQTRFGHL